MDKEIGKRIKFLRMKAGLTQTELAEKIGVSKQTLYKYENGIITNIPSDKIEAIAAVTGYSPGYIMGWHDILQLVLKGPNIDENSLIVEYQELNSDGKRRLREYLTYLLTKEEWKNKDKDGEHNG